MEDLRLTKEQKIGYNLIELRILFQRSIEILDWNQWIIEAKQFIEFTIKSVDNLHWKKRNKSTMKFEVESEGTSHFTTSRSQIRNT
jgi:hypothetical protein